MFCGQLNADLFILSSYTLYLQSFSIFTVLPEFLELLRNCKVRADGFQSWADCVSDQAKAQKSFGFLHSEAFGFYFPGIMNLFSDAIFSAVLPGSFSSRQPRRQAKRRQQR